MCRQNLAYPLCMVCVLQDSTLLFEVLPVHVMDEAMQLACSITRELLRKHNGYESLTEVCVRA